MSNKKLSQLPDNAAPAADGTSVAAVTATTAGGTTTYTNQIVTVRNLVKAGVQAGGVGLATVATTGSYTNLTNVPATFPPSSHNHDDRYYTEAETDALLAGKQATGNYATLDGTGRVPAAQLPSYVDDVEEYANLASLPNPGQQGKIYVALDTNKIYRWSATTYLEISPSPGSTDSVAEGSVNLYYTNARASAAAPVQSVAGRTGAVVLAKADVGLANVPNTDATLRANHTGTQAATTITGLATVATSGSYTDLSNRPATFPPSAHTHTLSEVTGAGTIATQNANSVAITGGSINGTTIGATTASTGRFTTVEAAGPDAAILVGTGSYGRFQLSGGNATGFLFGSFAALGDGVHLAYNYYANAAGTAVITNALGPTSRVTVGYGFVAFATSSANNTAPTERVRIDGSGNVGIGTTSPGARLHVAGSGQGIFIEDTGANRAVLGLYAFNNELRIQGTAYVNAAQPLTVWTANAERMRIDAYGNVGIGTTNPGSRLEVIHNGGQGINCLNNGGAGTVNYAVMAQAAGNALANTGLYVNCLNAAANYGVRIVNPPAGANNWAIYSDATAQSYFAGNVGIGTASPAVRLDVAAVSTIASGTWAGGTDFVRLLAASGSAFSEQAIAFQEAGANVGAKIGVKNQGNGAYDIIFANRDNSSLTSAFAERARITAAGNVGIGTASPSSRLHVAGGTITTDDGAISPRSIGTETVINFTTSRTLALTDVGRMLVFTGTSSATVTVPLNSAVAFPIGTRIRLVHAASGTLPASLTIAPYNSNPALRVKAYPGSMGPFNSYRALTGMMEFIKVDTDAWVLAGDVSQS